MKKFTLGLLILVLSFIAIEAGRNYSVKPITTPIVGVRLKAVGVIEFSSSTTGNPLFTVDEYGRVKAVTGEFDTLISSEITTSKVVASTVTADYGDFYKIKVGTIEGQSPITIISPIIVDNSKSATFTGTIYADADIQMNGDAYVNNSIFVDDVGLYGWHNGESYLRFEPYTNGQDIAIMIESLKSTGSVTFQLTTSSSNETGVKWDASGTQSALIFEPWGSSGEGDINEFWIRNFDELRVFNNFKVDSGQSAQFTGTIYADADIQAHDIYLVEEKVLAWDD